jgi:hypothetical protein
MREFEFTIIASGLDAEAEDFEDRFFDAGCDDATIAVQRGLIVLEFSRAGKSFGHALLSAITDVREAGAAVERIEPDTLVSLSEIARRTGLSRAAVSLYALEKRSEGFPAPVSRVTSDAPLWDWVAVARWFAGRRKGGIGRDDVVQARLVALVNEALSASPRQARMIERLGLRAA